MEKTIVQINERKIEVAQCWNDLSLEQQLYCYSIMMNESRGIFEPHELIPHKQLVITRFLLGLDDYFLDSWKQDCIKAHGEDGEEAFLDELSQVIQVSMFLWEVTNPEEVAEGGPAKLQVKLGLTKCPYPVIQKQPENAGRFSKRLKTYVKYYAPDDGLGNITFYEMVKIFTEIESYFREPKQETIDKLLAMVYRPKKLTTKERIANQYDGDIRIPFSDGGTEHRLPVFRQLALPVKQLLFFWLVCCQQAIVKEYPRVFRGKKGSGPNYGWAGVIFEMAGNDLTKSQEIGEQHHATALTHLQYLEDQRGYQDNCNK